MSDLNKGMDINSALKAVNMLCKKHTPKGDKGGNKPIIAGHNISFDIDFLKFAYNFIEEPMNNYWASNGSEIDRFDTLSMSKHKWKQESETSSYTLGTCLKRIGEDVIGAHKAINDVVANVKLLKHLLLSLRDSENAKKSNEKEEIEILSKEGEEFRRSFEF